jgi:nucleotide-binding universal stress UspA family protein
MSASSGERILVPFDGSPLSRRALERAVTMHPDARVTVLYVIDPVYAVYEAEARGPTAAGEWHDRMTEEAEAICAEAREQAEERGCEVESAVETGRPARAILSYVDEHDVDHVIMGSHGREGVSRLVLGSVAEQVMRQSPVPVTVVR